MNDRFDKPLRIAITHTHREIKQNFARHVFEKRKKDVLSKLDKSHKNSWDDRIKNLCDKINSLSNHYTLSSCSGRAILMVEQEKKAEGLFLFVYHDKVSLSQLKGDLKKIISPTTSTPTTHPQNVKLKFEPCILHVACRSLEDALQLYNKAKLAGWKKSGIIGMRNGISVELNATERLEFPIIRGGKVLVSDEFLEIIVEQADEKLEKSWSKIKKLEKSIV